MSTLWTPDGERPIRRDPPAGATGQPPAGGSDPAPEPGAMTEDDAKLTELRDQLARTPAALVVANHGFGLFELAALHLSLKPPQLSEAQLAIDSLAALVDGMAGRLGQHESQLRDGLAQLRIAYVQIKSANSSN